MIKVVDEREKNSKKQIPELPFFTVSRNGALWFVFWDTEKERARCHKIGNSGMNIGTYGSVEEYLKMEEHETPVQVEIKIIKNLGESDS